MPAPTVRATPGQFLTFVLAGEEYAVGILRVREIIELPPLTRVPTTPPCIRGVLNLRGGVVPVVDLAVKFGLGETAATRFTCVVIVEAELAGEATVMGLMVDAVRQVLELDAAALVPPPQFGTRIRTDYLLGMGQCGAKFVLLLDLDRVLSEAELLAVAAAADAAPAAAEGA
jgi:purine-binding chemotaxis protein CheW